MNLLDAYALVAFLVGGPAAPQVRAVLRAGDAAVSTANLAEALDVSERVYGIPIRRAMEVIEPLFDGALTDVPLDRGIARRAAELRAAHYHRTSRPVSLADMVLVASARPGDRIVTSDAHLLAVAAAEAIETVVLPEQPPSA